MKKNVKAVFAGMAAAALLAGFASCSNGSSDDALNNAASSSTTSSTDSTTTTPNASQTDTNKEDVFSGDLITYVISVASAEDADHTKLILQYDRSAAGAKEQISLTNVELAVSVNNEAVTMPSKLEFALDEYSSFEKDPGAKEDDADKQKTYKCIIDLNKALAVNDTVKVELKKATVTGEGASTVKLGSIVATVVDTAKAANYWREMSETKYQTLITKKNGGDLNATVVVTPPADNTNTPTDTTTTPATDTTTPANNTTTDTNNTSTDPAPATTTPAATTPTPVTVTNCKQYTVKLTKAVDASVIGYVLQIDNDGTKDADGLKIDVKNLTISVKVGDGEFTDKTFDAFNMIPNQWAEIPYSKTDCRKRLDLTGDLPQGTEITVRIKSATISNSAKKDAIIFALQEDGGSYPMLGTESGDTQDIWLPAFAAN